MALLVAREVRGFKERMDECEMTWGRTSIDRSTLISDRAGDGKSFEKQDKNIGEDHAEETTR